MQAEHCLICPIISAQVIGARTIVSQSTRYQLHCQLIWLMQDQFPDY